MKQKVFVMLCVLVICFFSHEVHAFADQIAPSPITLTKLGQIDTIGQARDVIVKNNIAFVTDMGTDYDTAGGLYIFNVSNPSQPSQLSHFYDGGRSHQLEFYNDSILLVADNTGGLEFFNIANLSNPVKIADFTGASYINAFALQNNTVFATSFTDGLIIIDISNITQPTELSRYYVRYMQPIALYQNYTFVSGLGSFNIFDISNLTNITLLKTYDYEISDFFISSDIVYAACSGSLTAQSQGFKIFNVSDLMNIQELSSFQDDGHPVDITVNNNYAFIADYYNGVVLFDVSNTSHIIKINNTFDGGNAFDLQIVGQLLFVADGTAGLKIYKINGNFIPSSTISLSNTSNYKTRTSPAFSVLVTSVGFFSTIFLKRKRINTEK